MSSSAPGPTARLLKRIAGLPPDAARELDAALERAQTRAAAHGRRHQVLVEFEVGEHGIEALEFRIRFERREG